MLLIVIAKMQFAKYFSFHSIPFPFPLHCTQVYNWQELIHELNDKIPIFGREQIKHVNKGVGGGLGQMMITDNLN